VTLVPWRPGRAAARLTRGMRRSRGGL